MAELLATIANGENMTTEEAISYANESGLMVGDDKGNFNPNKELTRAELASVIVRLDKLIEGEKKLVKETNEQFNN